MLPLHPHRTRFAENLRSPGWEPHSQTLQTGVFASKFPAATNALWTIVNRNEYDSAGEPLRVPHKDGMHYYDLWHGAELTPVTQGNEATLSFAIDGLGFGAVLATDQYPATDSLKDLLTFMSERSKRWLSSFSREWKAVPQTMVEISATKAALGPPPGMVRIPEGDYDFKSEALRLREETMPASTCNIAGKIFPHRSQSVVASTACEFLYGSDAGDEDASGYRPKDDHNFLRDWKDGSYRKDGRKSQ